MYDRTATKTRKKKEKKSTRQLHPFSIPVCPAPTTLTAPPTVEWRSAFQKRKKKVVYKVFETG
jgi:hypothetical protein